MSADGRLDLALLARALRRLLAEPPGHEISKGLLRGVSVLAAFSGDSTPRRLSEVAAELRMSTSAVQRCVATYAAAGLLERDGETRRYFRQGRFSI